MHLTSPGTSSTSVAAIEVMVRQATAKQMLFIGLSPCLGIQAMTPTHLGKAGPPNCNS